MYTVQVHNISGGDIVIQDPYPSEGRLTIPVSPGEIETREVMDSQYDRIKPQLDWHTLEGRIVYTSYNGPASKILNDSAVPGLTVQDALNSLVGGGGTSDMFISGGREGNNVSNVYLRGPGGTPMNLSGFVIPFNSTITSISMASRGVENWTLEVRKNNTATVVASLVSVGVERAYADTLSVDMVAGDEVQFYCNGTSISDPSGSIVIRRR